MGCGWPVWLPAIHLMCIVPDGDCMFALWQINVLRPPPSFSSSVRLHLAIYSWRILEHQLSEHGWRGQLRPCA